MVSWSRDVHGGWINSSIEALVEDCPELMAEFPLALITSIDSTPAGSLPGIQKALEKSGVTAEDFGAGILLPGKVVTELVYEHKLFNGFDEVWFHRQRPTEPKPESVTIVGPEEISDAVAPEVIQWMETSNCLLGLGDGAGLNYVTFDRKLANLLASL